MPMVVLGFALLFYLSALGFGLSFTALLIAHTVIGIPYQVRTVIGVYRSLPPDVEEAAAILGADRWRSFLHVTLPLIRPGIFAGGQQQRVALARSLVTNPRVLLLDEPLGALDKNLRESMQFELRQLQQTLGITTVLVTHDQEEALTMSDQVAVMRDGRLVQFGPPSVVYHRPISRFVAEFLGASNVIEAVRLRHDGDTLEARLLQGGMTIETLLPRGQPAAELLQIAVRPESISVSTEPLSGKNCFAAVVTGHIFRGTHHAVQVTLADGGQPLLADVPPRDVLPGQLDASSAIWLRWRPQDAVVLETDSAAPGHATALV